MAIRQTLLQTPAERIPPTLASLVADFCRPIPEIRAAYLGLTELRRDFDLPVERLSVAFELAEPAAGSTEGQREIELVADRFYATMPEDLQAGGCNILEPGGASAWEAKAQKVYPLPGAPSP